MVVLGMLYFLFAVTYFWGLRHLTSIWDSNAKEPLHFVALGQSSLSHCTLLVPFRNEEKNLRLLLPHFSENLPPFANVCFIDDHSADNGAEMVTQFIKNQNLFNWRLIKNNGIGKKAALTTGIRASKSAIIVTTDADVRINKGWLGHLIAPFQDPILQLVAGPVMTTSGNGIFGQFQQIEWASLILMTQVSFAKGNPLMCSGANLAFRKEAFEEVGGYDGNTHIPSGDDEFLLKKIGVKFGASATNYIVSPLSLVKTHALKAPLDWIRQRSRWASKWNAHKEQGHWLSAVMLAVFCLLLLASLPMAFLSWEFTLSMLLFWAFRVKFEKEALGKVLKHYGLRFSNLSWFLAGWIYPVLLASALPFAIFGNYTWKGRKT